MNDQETSTVARKLMERANVWVEINDLHDTVHIKNVTPAQAVILRSQFGVTVEGQPMPISPIVHLHKQEPVHRTASEEYARLRRIFPPKIVQDAFPGQNPNIPMTFAEIGLSETEEKAPKAGKEHDRVPLEKMAIEEVIDAESAMEVAKRKALEAQLSAQDKELAELRTMVAKLASGIEKDKQDKLDAKAATVPTVTSPNLATTPAKSSK